MLRHALMLSSVFAFALPFALPQQSSARPVTAPTPEAQWCWGDGCPGYEEDEEEDELELDLKLCVQAELELELQPRSCEVSSGPACEAQCTLAAVGPGCLAELSHQAQPRELQACAAERVEQCRSQCVDGGAAFCLADAPVLATRDAGGPKPPGKALGHCNPKNPHYNEKKCGKRPPKHDPPGGGGGGGGGDGGGIVIFVDIKGCIDIEID